MVGAVRGLVRFDPKSEEINRYSALEMINMHGILEDDHSNLWIGCEKGILVFNKISEEYRIYNAHDGIQESVFNTAPQRSKLNGDMIFGGIAGMNIFNPDSIRINKKIPHIAITDFQLFNKSIIPSDEEGSLIKKSTIYNADIILNHDQNNFSFEFTSLDAHTIKEPICI